MDDIDVTRIKIPYNWVLVELDKDFDTYHNTDTGMNTGIHVAPWGINQATHLGVTGIVRALPQELIFNGDDLSELKSIKDRSEASQRHIAELRRQSMAYAVPIEVPVGYRVYFEYSTRLNAEKEGRYITNSDGSKYVLIPYDLLVMTFRPDTDFNDVKISDVYMLNGFLLIKPLEYATEKGTDGIKTVKTVTDLWIPVQADAKYVHRNNLWYANILSTGCLVQSYADFPDAGMDGGGIGKPGQKICYDGRHQKRLEQEHHRVIFKKHTLYRLHRKDIFGWFPDGNITGLPNLNKYP